MKTSIAIFDINAKDGVMARASMRKDAPESVLTQKFPIVAGQPIQCALLDMTTFCLNMIREAAEKDPSLKGRYTFLVPESIAYRLFQAQRCVNEGKNIREELYLPWMKDDQFLITDTVENEDGEEVLDEFNAWESSIRDLATICEEMMDKKTGWSINVMNARTLYRWEIRQSDLAEDDPTPRLTNGMKVNFKNGVDEDLQLVCTENNFLNGELVVSESDVRDRRNNVTKHFYVPRTIQVTNHETGMRELMTVSDFMNLKGDDADKFEPAYENGALIINAAKLRTKTAELLPRVQVAKVMKVKTAQEGNALF
jgi:hypothetical protein